MANEFMNIQRKLLFSALLVALLIAIAIIFIRLQPTDRARQGHFLPELMIESPRLTKIRIDNHQRQPAIELEKSETGWLIVQRDHYPAAVDKVTNLVRALAQINVREQADNSDFQPVRPLREKDSKTIRVTLIGRNNYSRSVLITPVIADSRQFIRMMHDEKTYWVNQAIPVSDSIAPWLAAPPALFDIKNVKSVTFDGDSFHHVWQRKQAAQPLMAQSLTGDNYHPQTSLSLLTQLPVINVRNKSNGIPGTAVGSWSVMLFDQRSLRITLTKDEKQYWLYAEQVGSQSAAKPVLLPTLWRQWLFAISTSTAHTLLPFKGR